MLRGWQVTREWLVTRRLSRTGRNIRRHRRGRRRKRKREGGLFHPALRAAAVALHHPRMRRGVIRRSETISAERGAAVVVVRSLLTARVESWTTTGSSITMMRMRMTMVTKRAARSSSHRSGALSRSASIEIMTMLIPVLQTMARTALRDIREARSTEEAGRQAIKAAAINIIIMRTTQAGISQKAVRRKAAITKRAPTRGRTLRRREGAINQTRSSNAKGRVIVKGARATTLRRAPRAGTTDLLGPGDDCF